MTPIYGDPRLPERFWAKVRIEGPYNCWVWHAGLFAKGYAQFSGSRHSALGHREAYIALVGPVPDGLVIDHVCRERRCVNPQHLEPVTQRENLLRGMLPYVAGEHNSAKTHCAQGHEYSPENTGVKRQGHRYCRKCVAVWSKQKRERDKVGDKRPPGRPKGTPCQPIRESG